MRLGVNVPNFGPGTDSRLLADWTSTLEELGYDLLMVSDHVAVTPDVAARYPALFFDPLAVLAFLAARTERIGLGTTVVIAPYRHPLVTVQAAASVQLLSGGRLIPGVGSDGHARSSRPSGCYARAVAPRSGADPRHRGSREPAHARVRARMSGLSRARAAG